MYIYIYIYYIVFLHYRYIGLQCLNITLLYVWNIVLKIKKRNINKSSLYFVKWGFYLILNNNYITTKLNLIVSG